jgi:hypothetical protein
MCRRRDPCWRDAVPLKSRRSNGSKRSLTRIFRRDGFTDRYAGGPLVFPGALRALSIRMPAEFSYHPNWRQSQTHPAYWLLYPTLDHRVPLAGGGLDTEDNVVTTAMLRNCQKANWLLEELGWATSLEPCLTDWDGLLPWFMRMFEREPVLRQSTALRQWYAATGRPATEPAQAPGSFETHRAAENSRAG